MPRRLKKRKRSGNEWRTEVKFEDGGEKWIDEKTKELWIEEGVKCRAHSSFISNTVFNPPPLSLSLSALHC